MLSYASVPLYRMFCQITGYGGTTDRADISDLPTETYDREITVRFNTDTYGKLGWEFVPLQKSQTVKVGEHKLAFFKVRNTKNTTTKGTATFNVTPHKVGQYFMKVQCFCFEEQPLAAGEEMEIPVSYYVDPDILNDEDAAEVSTITLSYTFFPIKNAGNN